MIRLLGMIGHQWKGIMALSAATLVGASGGAYLTLPRAVGDLQDRMVVVEERLGQLVMQTGLIACLNLADFSQNREVATHDCVVQWTNPK